MSKSPQKNIIIDIETAPLSESELLAVMPPFDPADVKTGNAGPEKAAEKIAKAQAEHQAKFIEKAALSPLTGRVLAIGYLLVINGVAGQPNVYHGPDKTDEVELLSAAWSLFLRSEQRQSKMIGHNIYGFDLPFMVRRSWLLGIAVPETIIERGRYWSPVFVDTMAVWAVGGNHEYVKLDTLAKAFGVGGKPDGIAGADFSRLYFGTPDEREAALDYAANDLVMTYGVAQKMEIFG
jgi:hypothetical protein